MLPRTPGLLLIALLTWFPAPGQTHAGPVDDARADIRTTYDFDPSSMTFDEQSRQAPKLSKLWDRYAGNADTYAAALRLELAARGNRELLYCDGGMLLATRSSSPADTKLGLSAMERRSLAEIEHTPYFYTLHHLAKQGVDTFDLQVRMLTKPRYSVFIVMHSLSLGQDYAFVYPFLVQEESVYTPRLVLRLASESDPVAQKSLLRALWYSATPEAEAAIRAFSAGANGAAAVRADAAKMLESLATLRAWKADEPALKGLLEALDVGADVSERELRESRRKRMRGISDEALYELDMYTALIYRQRSH